MASSKRRTQVAGLLALGLVLALAPSSWAGAQVPAECVQAGKPYVERAQMWNRGGIYQILDIKIQFGEWPPACAGLRRVEQYQLMIKGKDGTIRPFSPPYYWPSNGTYVSNEAGWVGGERVVPPNSPTSIVRRGEKPLLTMRERIQRLSDKKIVAEVIKWHKIKNVGSRPHNY